MSNISTISRRHLTAGLAALPVAGAAAFAGDRAIAFGGTPSFEEFATAFRELDPRIKRLLLLMTREYEVESSPEWDADLYRLISELEAARARYEETSEVRSRAEDAYFTVAGTRPEREPAPAHVVEALASSGWNLSG